MGTRGRRPRGTDREWQRQAGQVRADDQRRDTGHKMNYGVIPHSAVNIYFNGGNGIMPRPHAG
jgi:hypothetical protein